MSPVKIKITLLGYVKILWDKKIFQNVEIFKRTVKCAVPITEGLFHVAFGLIGQSPLKYRVLSCFISNRRGFIKKNNL